MAHLAQNNFVTIYLLLLVASSLDMIPLEILRLLIIRRWFPHLRRTYKRTMQHYLLRAIMVLAALVGPAILYLLGILSRLPIFLLWLAPYDLFVVMFPYVYSYLSRRGKKRKETNLYDEAQHLLAHGMYNECLTLLTGAIESGLGSTTLYHNRGVARYELGDYQGARADYQQALALDPHNVAAITNLGLVSLAEKNYEAALQQYEVAHSLEPENGGVHYHRGDALRLLGRIEDALEAYSCALTYIPDDAGAYLNRGNLLGMMGRRTEALADYEQAFHYGSDDINIVWTVAWSRMSPTSKPEKMMGSLANIAELEPDHYTAFLCQAVRAFLQYDLPAAFSHAKKALELAPDEWDGHFWLGMILASSQPEQAQQSIQKSLELGLPLFLLTPLHWLAQRCPNFFEEYADTLLTAKGV